MSSAQSKAASPSAPLSGAASGTSSAPPKDAALAFVAAAQAGTLRPLKPATLPAPSPAATPSSSPEDEDEDDLEEHDEVQNTHGVTYPKLIMVRGCY
jgi:hypothetical protein